MLRIASLFLLCIGASALAADRDNGHGHDVLKDSLKPNSKDVQQTAAGFLPVPATTRCIVIMCFQYMLIYLALALCRTYNDFSGAKTHHRNVEAGLKAAAQTVTYGPMLCVLFIACRMRVEFLSDGKDQPQLWVQRCMYAVTYAVLASTLVVLLIPLITGKAMPLKEGSCDLERQEHNEGESKLAFYALTAVRYMIFIGLYGGVAGIIVGINVYTPPGESNLAKLPAPAPAVMCTMILAVVFFVTQLIIAACRTYEEYTGTGFPKIELVMQAAATTVEFAPMLSILFLAARMRALQHDGQPQVWAQQCMFVATGSMCMTTLLAIAVPLIMGGEMKVDPRTGEQDIVVPSPYLGYVLVFFRFICMFGFYGSAIGVIYSIFTFEAPAGPHATLPISPAVQCVVSLTCQFFLVYFMMTVMGTVSELSGGKVPMKKYRIFAALEASQNTLRFAPMLAILFVTTRMYALLLTDNKGAPQAWVQDGMYMATWALLLSFLSCICTGFLVSEVIIDGEGNFVNKFSNSFVHIAMTIVRYLTMMLLYSGMAIVITGIFLMTPETANGRGSVPVVSDAVRSVK